MKKINFVAVLSMTALIFGAISCKTNAKGVEYEPTQKLTETIVPTEAKAEYSQGLNKKYFYFGDYPQTKVAPEALPSMSTKPASNGWYIGADGKYYGKVGDDYYLVEPILWCEVTDAYDYDGHSEDYTGHEENEVMILDELVCPNGKQASLLIAESILKAVPYYYDCTESYSAANLDEAKENDSKIRTIDGVENIFTNNYKYSQLRAFLNGLDFYKLDNTVDSTYKNAGFLNGAFSAKAQKELLDVKVINDGKSGTENTICHGGYPSACDSKISALSSEPTTDKVFVLSMYELANCLYGFGNGNEGSAEVKQRRMRNATEYAEAEGASTTYWERTPYYKNGCSLRYVTADGRTYENTLADSTNVGVVPAIVVNIAK